jgi:hypothetical protein
MQASCGPMTSCWHGLSLPVMTGSGSRGVTGFRSHWTSLTGQQSLSFQVGGDVRVRGCGGGGNAGVRLRVIQSHLVWGERGKCCVLRCAQLRRGHLVHLLQ